jgi:hypothetical protein
MPELCEQQLCGKTDDGKEERDRKRENGSCSACTANSVFPKDVRTVNQCIQTLDENALNHDFCRLPISVGGYIPSSNLCYMPGGNVLQRPVLNQFAQIVGNAFLYRTAGFIHVAVRMNCPNLIWSSPGSNGLDTTNTATFIWTASGGAPTAVVVPLSAPPGRTVPSPSRLACFTFSTAISVASCTPLADLQVRHLRAPRVERAFPGLK